MRKVLVVEDNMENLTLITYALQRAGYTVVAAETGEEGIEIALKERPMFIIMDIDLPGIDGIETTRRIRVSEIGSSIPIIAITSYAMVGDKEAILEAGCNGYFQRPIDPVTIMDRIERIINK